MSWNPITWLPRRTPGKAPQSADVPTKPEQKELAKIVPEMRADYQVTFCEAVLAANVAAVEVTVAGDDAVLVPKLQELWDNTTAGMTEDIAYGRVAFELEWDEAGGRQYPRKAEAFAFEDSRMKLADGGEFAGIEFRTKSNEWGCLAPVNSWWMALDATAKYPHGRSRFLPAPYEVFKDKRAAKENRQISTRKWAHRGPIISGPTEVLDPQTQQPRNTLEYMAPAVDVWAKGGLLLLPNDTHPNDQTKPAWTVVQADLKDLDPTAINATIDRLDVEMLRAFRIPEKTVIEGQAVGSFALVTQQMRILFAVIDDIISQRTTSYKKYVIAKTEEVNGLPVGGIDITHVKLTNTPDAFVYEVVKLLLSNPAVVAGIVAGGLDMEKLLKDAGLPVTDQLKAVLQVTAQSIAATGAQPAAPAPGEFGDMGRRQFTNNVKAIRDILDDLIAGKLTDVRAHELLQSLGLDSGRVDRLIADARDNSQIDDPDLQQAAKTMAQVIVPGQDFRVPQASQVVNAGLREFARLYDDLVVALANKASLSTLNAIRRQIVELEADMRTAGRVLGMLSPWQPRVNTYADSAGADADRLPKTLASKWRWPWIEDAIDFLISRKVVTAEQFATMATNDRRHVFSAPGIDTAKQLKSLQQSLAKSLEEGEDLRGFRKRIEGETALTRAQTETMYRTETKRGYVAGFEKALASPFVRDEFPAVLYTATPDQRVRDEHWALDNTVVLRSDAAAYRLLQKAANDYNCRCSMIPVSMEEAESHGISTYNDLPAEARAKYG